MADKKTVLKKDKTVEVKTKSGQSFRYKFTSLAQIHEYLDEKGWSYEATINKVEGEDYMFITKINEKDERSEPLQEARIPKPDKMTVQDYGSILSSVRRYSLQMAYGLASEDEDDGGKPQSQPSQKRLDFEAIKATLAKAKDIESVDNYEKKVAEAFPQMTANQSSAVKKIFDNRRKELS